jgi:hypothetical protein
MLAAGLALHMYRPNKKRSGALYQAATRFPARPASD